MYGSSLAACMDMVHSGALACVCMMYPGILGLCVHGVCRYTWVCVHVYRWTPEVTVDAMYDPLVISTFISVISSSSSSSFFSAESHWAQRLLFQCGWLARELQESSCLQLSPHPVLGLQMQASRPTAWCGCQKIPTHAHVCETPSVLPTELYPQPKFMFLIPIFVPGEVPLGPS